jgi:crotonobetaine/carnitine-CoA ligase
MARGTVSATATLLPQVVAQRAADSPGKPLLQDVGSGDLTGRQAHEAALRWASMLEDLGVRRAEPVATMLPTSSIAVTAWLGAAWLGAIDVPLNTAYFGSMLQSVLRLVASRVLVVDGRLVDRLVPLADRLPQLRTVLVAGPPDALPVLPWNVLNLTEALGAAAVAERPAPTSLDVSCGIFTSGTTGPSKCVLVPWGQVHAMYGEAMARPWGDDEAMYVHSPMNHLIARGLVYQGALATDGRVVLREQHATDRWWHDVRAYRCTEATITGVVARWLWDQPPADDDADNPLRRIAIVPLIPEARAFAERFDVEVYTAYGSTEIGVPFVSDGLPSDLASCGRLVPGPEVRLVMLGGTDQDSVEGQVGELLVRSRPGTINLGYLNLPESTASAWRGGWFHTGDAFRRDADGNYYFVDRLKDVIRRRGENISSVEIEREADAHPAVVQSAAIPVPSEDSEDEIKLFVEPRPGVQLDSSSLVSHLEERLPRFMVPRFVEVIDELPRTETGRVHKGTLRSLPVVSERTLDRAPNVTRSSSP